MTSPKNVRVPANPGGLIYAKNDKCLAKTPPLKSVKICLKETYRAGVRFVKIDSCRRDRKYLRKFNGIPKTGFRLYLKEREWMFNKTGSKN